MSDVVLEHVGKIYGRGDTPAVDDFNLAVRDGEFLVLVGPSGCGKSTTLRMIAGLEIPTAGTIRIGARDVTNLPPKDRDIAMVFQNYALYPHMTVAENMAFALKLRKFPKAEIAQRVGAAAEALGLTPYLKRLPKALSGGQRQRVALGRAIVREPAVFLFDEPLSNLDAKMRVEMRAEIIRLHHRLGATMIYVTHDQTEAMTMGERIVVMNAGHIQQVAAPLEIYEHPANPFVAGFIGTPPMNLFPKGTLAAERVVGLRPEHITIAGTRASPPQGPAAGTRASPPQGPAAGTRASPPQGTFTGGGGALAPASAEKLRASVDFTEPLGNETLVHVVLTPSNFHAIVRVPGFAPYKPGDAVTLNPDLSKAVKF